MKRLLQFTDGRKNTPEKRLQRILRSLRFKSCVQSGYSFRILPSLCKKGGYFISYKSGAVKEEAQQAEKAIKILGGEIKDIIYFSLPDSEIQRSLVVIEKTGLCPARYPRKAGTPLKEPL